MQKLRIGVPGCLHFCTVLPVESVRPVLETDRAMAVKYKNEFTISGVVQDVRDVQARGKTFMHAIAVAGMGVTFECGTRDPKCAATVGQGMEVEITGHMTRRGFDTSLQVDTIKDLITNKPVWPPAAK